MQEQEKQIPALKSDILESEWSVKEAELRESLQRFSVLFECSPAITMLARHPAATIQDVNQAFERITGYSRAEVRGKTGDELGIVTLVARQSMLAEMREHGMVRNYEVQLHTRSGEERTVLANVDLIEIGGESYSLVTCIDVTELRRSEAAVRERDARLRAMFDTEPECVKLLGPDGSLLEMNRAGLDMIEADNFEQVSSLCVFPLVAPSDRDRFRELTKQVFAGQSGRLVFQIIGLRGTIRWLETHAVPLRDESGTVTSLLGVTRDISEQKDMEEQLLREGEFQTQIMEALPGLVVMIDAEGHITRWNKAVEKACGYAAHEIPNLLPVDLVAQTDRDHISRLLREVFLHGHSTTEVRIRSRAGREAPHVLSGVEVDSRSGAQCLIVGVDVSERYRLEEQLRQSQKMEAFGQLAAGIAHDFNNLLTVITGFSELLLESMSPQAPEREACEAVLEAGNQAVSLTRQLLTFSRRAIFNPVVVSPNKVVEDTVRLLRRTLEENVTVIMDLDPAVKPVMIDPDQLAQVLMNLAINARDAMPLGGTLKIETRNVSLDEDYVAAHLGTRLGEHVLVSVSDTGNGMPEAIKARIFEPFFTTKGVNKGTGLGLAVVDGIIKQSGGTIEVASTEAIGTCFKMCFPAAGEEKLTIHKDAVTHFSLGTETILFVEDEDMVRTLGVTILQSRGYNVLSASSGEEALHLLERSGNSAALLITDVVMPGMNGRQLAETLRPLYPLMKVLFVSGYTDDTMLRQGIQQSTVEFMQKPYSPAALAKRVRELLNAG